MPILIRNDLYFGSAGVLVPIRIIKFHKLLKLNQMKNLSETNTINSIIKENKTNPITIEKK